MISTAFPVPPTHLPPSPAPSDDGQDKLLLSWGISRVPHEQATPDDEPHAFLPLAETEQHAHPPTHDASEPTTTDPHSAQTSTDSHSSQTTDTPTAALTTLLDSLNTHLSTPPPLPNPALVQATSLVDLLQSLDFDLASGYSVDHVRTWLDDSIRSNQNWLLENRHRDKEARRARERWAGETREMVRRIGEAVDGGGVVVSEGEWMRRGRQVRKEEGEKVVRFAPPVEGRKGSRWRVFGEQWLAVVGLGVYVLLQVVFAPRAMEVLRWKS